MADWPELVDRGLLVRGGDLLARFAVHEDERVLVRIHVPGRGKRSGAYLEHDFFEVLTFDDARIVRFEMIRDEAAARAAAGLLPRKANRFRAPPS